MLSKAVVVWWQAELWFISWRATKHIPFQGGNMSKHAWSETNSIGIFLLPDGVGHGKQKQASDLLVGSPL